MDPKPKREDYPTWEAYVNNYSLWILNNIRDRSYIMFSLHDHIKADIPKYIERLFLVERLLIENLGPGIAGQRLSLIKEIVRGLIRSQWDFNEDFGLTCEE